MQSLLFVFLAALSPTMEGLFMNQCMSAVQDKSSCECALKRLGEKYSEKTFLSLQTGMLSSEEENAILQDLFLIASDCFVKNECANEITFIVGPQEASSICQCAVENIKKMEKKEQAAFLSLEGNFVAENEKRFEEMIMKEIYPCLPKKLTPSIRNNLIKECAKGTTQPQGEKLCACVTDEVFKQYSISNFFKDTFGNSQTLEETMQKATKKCKAQ